MIIYMYQNPFSITIRTLFNGNISCVFLSFQGPMNNMDLSYISENYFSKTKPQQIISQVVFAETVTFAEDIQADDIQLFGPIIEEER